MPKPGSKLPVLDANAIVEGNDAVTRRAFVGVVTWGAVTAALAACGGGGEPTNPGGPGSGGGGGGGTTTLPSGVTVNGNTVTINLTQQPSLATTNGFLLVAPPKVFVINLGSNNYRAFTSICTHQGCNVETFASGRMVCPCHGSQYDTSGQPVAGPAPSALTEFAAQFTAPSTLTVTKS